jgi:chromosome partitioning protein
MPCCRCRPDGSTPPRPSNLPRGLQRRQVDAPHRADPGRHPQSAFVIVDLEGTASRTVVYAVSRADLVIIPTQGSQLDAAEAVKTFREVCNVGKSMRRTAPIPTAILFTRTSPALRPRSLRAIEAEFLAAGIKVMGTQVNERDAFRAIFAFGGSLSGLDASQVSNIQGAIINARAFAGEVVALLKQPRPVVLAEAV